MAGKSFKKRLMDILQALLGSGNRIGKEAVPTSHTSLPSTRNSQQHVYCGAPVAPQGSPGQGMVHKQWLHVEQSGTPGKIPETPETACLQAMFALVKLNIGAPGVETLEAPKENCPQTTIASIPVLNLPAEKLETPGQQQHQVVPVWRSCSNDVDKYKTACAPWNGSSSGLGITVASATTRK